MKNLFMALVLLSTVFASAQAYENKSQAIKAYKQEDISRYPVPKIEEFPEDMRKILEGAKKKYGFYPNVILALAHRPAEFRAFFAYAKAVMGKKSGLSKAEKEMIVLVHSSYNSCTYCLASHGAALRIETKNPILADQITANYLEADITPRQKAILDFAMKVTNNSSAIDEEDFKTLHKHGLNDEDIWDIASITSFFNMSNRMMNFGKIRPNAEYYSIGR